MRMKTALSVGKSTDMSRNGDEADIVVKILRTQVLVVPTCNQNS